MLGGDAAAQAKVGGEGGGGGGEDGRIGRYETAFLKIRVVAHLLRRKAKGKGGRKVDCEGWKETIAVGMANAGLTGIVGRGARER